MTVNITIGILIGYGLANTNNLQPTFQALYGWPSERAAAWNNSAIGASYLLGLTIGAFFGGLFIKDGRRVTIFAALAFGTFGCASQASLKYEVSLLIGRVFYGVSSGILSTCVNRYTEEMVPLRVFKQMAPWFHFSIVLGSAIGTFTAMALPDEESTAAQLVQDHAWRWILGAPIFGYFIVLVILKFFIRLDSPKFYILTGRKDKALEAIHRIYGPESD